MPLAGNVFLAGCGRLLPACLLLAAAAGCGTLLLAWLEVGNALVEPFKLHFSSEEVSIIVWKG